MKQRYGIVLVLILASLAFQLAAPDTNWSQLVTIVLQGATLVMIAHASELHHLMRRFAEAAAIAATILAVIALASAGDEATTAGRFTNLLLLAIAPWAIGYGVVKGMRGSGRITLSTIAGVLCVYLLLGMIFAAAYNTIYDIEGAFFAQSVTPTNSDFLYFSYVTQTTTGFGDLTAGTDLARSLTILEALLGQIYLVTVVATIVGNVSRDPRRKAAPPQTN